LLKLLIRLQTLALLAKSTAESHGRLPSRTFKPEFLELFGNVTSDAMFLYQAPLHWLHLALGQNKLSDRAYMMNRHRCYL
jgi:hypothetical protein